MKGKRYLHSVDRSLRRRERYNPLRGLSIDSLVSLLDEGEAGLYANVQDLYRMIERRDATVLALKQRRLGAIEKLDWDIKIVDKVPAGFTQAQAERQADFLRSLYDGVENLVDSFSALELAVFRGYSFLEIRENQSARPVEFVEIPQWHFVRDFDTWEWLYDPEALNDGARGIPIRGHKLISRELDYAIDEIASIAFLRKNLSKKDWDAFVETHGLPSIFIMLAQNTPPDKIEEYLDVAERITGDGRGALPPGSEVKTVSEWNRGKPPFKEHINQQDEEVVLAGTGGKLTMLNDSTGLGSGQSQSHEHTFDAIAQASAAKISMILQRDVDQRYLRREFPSQPVMAYFELAFQDREDMDALAKRVATLAESGFQADEKEMSEKFGIKLKRKERSPGVVRPVSVYSNRWSPKSPKPAASRPRKEALSEKDGFNPDQPIYGPDIPIRSR